VAAEEKGIASAKAARMPIIMAGMYHGYAAFSKSCSLRGGGAAMSPI